VRWCLSEACNQHRLSQPSHRLVSRHWIRPPPIGQPVDPDLRIWTPMDSPDDAHETTDQKVGGSSPPGARAPSRKAG
jgi:hypothetical protein